MTTTLISLFLLLVAAAASASASADAEFNLVHALRPRSASRSDDLNCMSWRLAVETNNLRDWKNVPQTCEGYIGNYMMGKQYKHDCDVVADAAIEYAKSLKLGGDGLDAWVFDIDETTLSNMPYYARSDVLFGALPYNATKFDEWVAQGAAPALLPIRRVYNTVRSLGIKAIFLTGTNEKFKTVRIQNLKKAGYHGWNVLILKGEAEKGQSAVEFKSGKREKLVKKGYRIVGNIGDQWSDLVGSYAGNRTFKVPDPMYYIG